MDDTNDYRSRSLPNGNALTSPPPRAQQSTLQEKAFLLQSLLAQSYEIFNIYGKEPEALSCITQAFLMVLEDESAEDIRMAFKKWMRESSTFQTPADILRIIRETKADRNGDPIQKRICDDLIAARRGELRPIMQMSPEEREASIARVREMVAGLRKFGGEA